MLKDIIIYCSGLCSVKMDGWMKSREMVKLVFPAIMEEHLGQPESTCLFVLLNCVQLFV